MALFFKKKKKEAARWVYLDHAAATPVDPAVREAMQPFWSERFANPSAIHTEGQSARYAIDAARDRVAEAIGARPKEIIFTSGATEANNLVILGTARKYAGEGNHLVVGIAEHSSVLEPVKQLEREGFEVTYVQTVGEAIDAIREDTILVSLMMANNEVGTIHRIDELGKAILKHRKKTGNAFPYLHTDVCQAINYLPIAVDRLHCDLLTLNGSKIYGPKGVGALYKRDGLEIEPLVYGGGQEGGVRSGTEFVSGIVGLGVAIQKAVDLQPFETQRVAELQEFFLHILTETVQGVGLNGPALGTASRLPNNINVAIADVEGEQLVLYLDAKGISCSVGAACSETSDTESHVLESLGYDKKRVQSSVRFSLGRLTEKKDIEYTVTAIRDAVSLIRS